MQIYKFGGSSLKNADGILKLRQIVGDVDQSLVLVVSALGKTTNARVDKCGFARLDDYRL